MTTSSASGPFRRLGRLLALAAAVGVGALLMLAVVVPRLGGATPYVVTTGSMTPTLPVGTLVVVRAMDPFDVGIGDVITYQLDPGEPVVVTHRVVGLGYDGTGRPLFRTQGDANDAPDPEWVRPVQVRGETWYAVPHVGRAGALLTDEARQWATRVAAGLLLCYGVVLVVDPARWLRSRPRGRHA